MVLYVVFSAIVDKRTAVEVVTDMSDMTVIVEESVPATDTTSNYAPRSTGSCVADVTSPDVQLLGGA